MDKMISHQGKKSDLTEELTLFSTQNHETNEITVEWHSNILSFLT
jgi:hypothetical protein